jgi:hypothetical protein
MVLTRRPLTMMVIAAGLLLSGCSGARGAPTIDGFILGALAVCSPPVDVDAATLDASCAGFSKRATAALDARDPGHAAIVSTQMYSDGSQPGPIDVTGDATPPTQRSAHPGPLVYVFVFKLSDGSTRATGVACSDEPVSCVGVAAYPG